MNGIFCSTTAKTNEEYKIVIKRRMKRFIAITIIGIITASIATYAEFFMNVKISDRIIALYSGMGTGLTVGGIILAIKNNILLKNEEKLKQSRLSNTDERMIVIGDKSFKAASKIMIWVIYAAAIIFGIFYQVVFELLMFIICIFLIVYIISLKYYSSKM